MGLLALLMTAFTLLPMPLQAGSVGCGPTPTLEVAAAEAAAVFVGEAGSVSPTSDTVTFEVDWQWKGRQVPSRVEVTVAGVDDLPASAASRTFATGVTYLVFAQNAFRPFVVDACSASAPYGDGSVIPPSLWEPLGRSEPQVPSAVGAASSGPRPPTFNAMAAAALLGVTVLLVGRVIWGGQRRRKARMMEQPRPHKLSRRTKAWLAEEEGADSVKQSFGERELRRQRKTSRKRREKRQRAATKAAAASDEPG